MQKPNTNTQGQKPLVSRENEAYVLYDIDLFSHDMLHGLRQKQNAEKPKRLAQNQKSNKMRMIYDAACGRSPIKFELGSTKEWDIKLEVIS